MKRVAVVGLGGYAAQHHQAFENLEAQDIAQVVATCDPVLESPRVPTYRTLDELLKNHPDLDLVTLPVPVPLHAAMHQAVVGAGIPCYLEKPPTLWWPEFEAMLAVEARAIRPTQVGFNFVGDHFRQAIRTRIDAGEFGPLRQATFLGIWPRDEAYYNRATWAGKLQLNDKPVLDNPLGNAMAHYVQNLLYFSHAQELATVEALLTRSHHIESFDTAFIAARLPNGVELRLAATHASTDWVQTESLIFDAATVAFPNWNRAEIHTANGVESLESAMPDQLALLQSNLENYLNGVAPTPLSNCAPFVSLIDLALLSSNTIETLPEDRITRANGNVTVRNLDEQLRQFTTQSTWPGPNPQPVDPASLNHLSSNLLSTVNQRW